MHLHKCDIQRVLFRQVTAKKCSFGRPWLCRWEAIKHEGREINESAFVALSRLNNSRKATVFLPLVMHCLTLRLITLYVYIRKHCFILLFNVPA